VVSQKPRRSRNLVRGGEIGQLLSVSPILILSAILLALPSIWLVVLSLYRKGLDLSGYKELFRDTLFLESLLKTLAYASITVALQVTLGSAGALWAYRFTRAAKPVSIGLFLPYVVPSVVAVVMWRFFIEERGLISELTEKVLGPEGRNLWMGDWILGSLVIVSVWQFYPFVFVAILARLRQIPKELYLSAEIDGANAWEQFRFITLPAIRSTLLAVIMLRFVFMATKFDTPWLIGGRTAHEDISVLSIFVYENGFRLSGIHATPGSAAIVLVTVAAAMSVLFLRLRKGADVDHDQE
jgi:multiple sugar transport system permease protein